MVETCTTLTPPIHILSSIMPRKGFCVFSDNERAKRTAAAAKAIEDDERAIFNLI